MLTVRNIHMGKPPRLYKKVDARGGAESSGLKEDGQWDSCVCIDGGGSKPLSQPVTALGWLSGFTICLRDGVTNGNKCVSFMGNMWESSCPRLGDSAGVDCLGTVKEW